MSGQSRSIKPSRGTSTHQKRNLDPNFKIAQHTQRDRIRNADAAELEKIIQKPTENPFADENFADPATDETLETNESEIDLFDEDDMDDGRNYTDFIEAPFQHDVSTAMSSVASGKCFVIAMLDEKAVFQIPGGLLGCHNDELTLKWNTYQQLAKWLTNERPDFTRQPSFEALAGKPPAENPGHFTCPVTQEGLMKAMGFEKGKDLFSKHLGHGLLVWFNYGEMQVEQMWSKKAKWAWCAMMASHRQKQSSDPDLLNPSIQPPRSSGERLKIRNKAPHVWDLGTNDFVKLLCVLADCSWADVIQNHRKQIEQKGNNHAG